MKGKQTRTICLPAVAAVLLAVLAVPMPAPTQTHPEPFYAGMRWRLIGPFRGGRTRAVAGVHGHPDVLYIGPVNGGVWRSLDYGRTWEPIFDAMPVGSIGAIAVAPSNPDVIYVGSGEGLQRPDLSVGNGVYKSTDGGHTWVHVGLDDAQQIPQIAVDPHNPDRVFVAVLGHPFGPSAQRGIFRSTDGGRTWQRVLYVDDNTGGSDVAIDPSNPQIVYAALWESRLAPWEYGNAYSGTQGGLFKSTDGGDHWRRLQAGLPSGVIQVNLAIAPSRPSRLYASVATASGVGLYRSDNAGESWVRITEDPRPATRIGGGDLPVLRVDPKNPDVVYSASIVFWRSTDGGRTWTAVKGAPGGDDYQNLWIDPEDPRILLLASDQGAVVSVNGGQSWSSWYNQPTAQLFHVQTDNAFPYRVCGGQQDSGSVCVASRGDDGEVTFRDWHPVGAIEYGYVAPDPLDPDIVYGAGTNTVTRYNRRTGQTQNVSPVPLRSAEVRVDRTQPLIFSPVDPHILYYATSVLFKTSDGGRTWETISPDLTREHPGIPPSVGLMARQDPQADRHRGVIYAIGPSFRDVRTIWVGTDDGLIWVTRDGGQHWSNVTPPDLSPWSKVTQIVASHFDDHTAYASVSRLRVDDLHPYIYRTHDDGRTWQKITLGLPEDAPVNVVREDPVRPGLLFAGTENAVWVSFDDGEHWHSLQLNLPHTSMRDLWIHENDLIVATHGRSFWILDDITPLRQITPQLETADQWLFDPAPAYRVRRDTNTDTPLPPEEPAGENPPSGAILDYYLARDASGPVTLEILDEQGRPVRRYTSQDRPIPEFSDPQKLTIPAYWVEPFQALPAGAGMHRWVWDLHYEAPLALRHEFPISAVPHRTPLEPQGPRALPGRYTVRLTVNGRSLTRSLLVKMDPRVRTSPPELRAQFDAEEKLARIMTDTAQAIQRIRDVRTRLQALNTRNAPELQQAVSAFLARLEALEGRPAGFMAPVSGTDTLQRVHGDAAQLYALIDAADEAPTAAQGQTLAQVEERAGRLLQQWKAVLDHDLPELNQRLQKNGLPAVSPTGAQ